MASGIKTKFHDITVASEELDGPYGPYWRVHIEDATPNSAFVSLRVWKKSGLALPGKGDRHRAVLVRKPPDGNRRGGWRIVAIDGGPMSFEAARTTVIEVEKPAGEKTGPGKRNRDPDRGGERRSRRYALRVEDSGTDKVVSIWARSGTFESQGIMAVPVGFTMVANWRRDGGDWCLTRVCDDSVSPFFGPASKELPVRAGKVLVDWNVTGKVKDIQVRFDTELDGVVITCTLQRRQLIDTGLRSLRRGDVIKASMRLGDGRWRISEVLEPNPCAYEAARRKRIFGVRTVVSDRYEARGKQYFRLDVPDRRTKIETTTMSADRLVRLSEPMPPSGTEIVCDLQQSQKGTRWYASLIHRVTNPS